MGNALQMASIHIEVWTAGPRILDSPHELLTTPRIPYRCRCSERKLRIHLSASLCAGAT
jgi:hypothetical protein